MRLRDPRRGQPGVRLDLRDLAILAAALALRALVRAADEPFPLWWFPAHVARPFLCFRNLLRVGTVPDLPWAAAAALSPFWTLSEGRGDLWAILLASEPFRALAVLRSLRIGWYRGALRRPLLAAFGHEPERVAFGRKPPFRLPFGRRGAQWLGTGGRPG